MGDENLYDSMLGTFSFDENAPPNGKTKVSLSRGPERNRGDWNLLANAADADLSMPDKGRWLYRGWCDHEGDHNFVDFLGPSGRPVVTLKVDGKFTELWLCGTNFIGDGVHLP